MNLRAANWSIYTQTPDTGKCKGASGSLDMQV